MYLVVLGAQRKLTSLLGQQLSVYLRGGGKERVCSGHSTALGTQSGEKAARA